MDEFANLTDMNGYPAFITPLYGGTAKAWGDNPNPLFYAGDHSHKLASFSEQYQRLLAFELTKKYKVVFTRSIDMVDYFRRHFDATPPTVFSSNTRHPLHDMWWLSSLNNHGIFTAPERIPWNTRLSVARKIRKDKDPLSCEFVRIEDQKHQIRFERECPSPTWWFDYTRQERNDKGSVIRDVEVPDVMIRRSQSFSPEKGLTITLTMKTTAVFPGYAVALWGLPIDYRTPPDDIVTTAHSYTLVRNAEGETHMVLYFDLRPDAQLNVVLRKPASTQWEW